MILFFHTDPIKKANIVWRGGDFWDKEEFQTTAQFIKSIHLQMWHDHDIWTKKKKKKKKKKEEEEEEEDWLIDWFIEGL